MVMELGVVSGNYSKFAKLYTAAAEYDTFTIFYSISHTYTMYIKCKFPWILSLAYTDTLKTLKLCFDIHSKYDSQLGLEYVKKKR